MSLLDPEIIRLDLPASVAYLHLLSDCISEMLNLVDGLTDRDGLTYAIQLAAHEVCTNVVNHAYCGQRAGRIPITLTLMPQPPRFIVDIYDTGSAFDPASVAPPDLDDAQVHGYGLFLVHNLMDSAVYTTEASCNHWCLTKNL